MLNESQKIAVEHTEGPLLILAGAGAGKTHTLTERVAYMVKELGILPGSILCVTFTNKAAKEMKERIGKTLGRDVERINPYRSFDFPLIGTFHSIGVYFLRMFIDRLGYEKNFTIIDEDDKLRLIRGILEEKGLDTKEFGARPVAYAISNAKNYGIDAKSFGFNVKNFFEEKVSEVFNAYEERLKSMNSLDFDDILSKMSDILEIPDVLKHFHDRFQYFLVDEYQDTNETQYRIMKRLASESKNICVVGDDWQGIYSWRGANIKNIFNFQRDYKDCKIVKLEQNYRSTKRIIEAANHLIKNNLGIMDKTLWTENEQGECISIIETQDEKHEAEIVATEIRDILDDKPGETIAVLYRTNGQSRLIEEGLLRKGIQYRVFGGVKFYDRKEIRDILSYLKLLQNPNDSISFKRIINVPSRKLGTKSTDTFLDYVRVNRIAPINLLLELDRVTDLPAQAKKGFQSFAALYQDLLFQLSELPLDKLLWRIVEATGYEAYLMDEYGAEEYESRMDNLIEFKNMASRYVGIDTDDALQMFLEEIALITDADRENDSAASMVSLMTIHLSKGLEFDHVFLVGAEEGIFPHVRTLQEPKDLEEERRLMYVSMTRAKKKLSISRANERFQFGSYSANPPSRFLKEMPSELLQEVSHSKYGFSSAFGSASTSSFSFGSESIPKSQIRSITHHEPGSFQLGDRVKHVKFGTGTIVALDGNRADIAFAAGVGIKKMNIEIAPLEKE